MPEGTYMTAEITFSGKFGLADLRRDLSTVWRCGYWYDAVWKFLCSVYIIAFYIFAKTVARTYGEDPGSKTERIEIFDAYLNDRQHLGDRRWLLQTGRSWQPILCLSVLFCPIIMIAWMTLYYIYDLFRDLLRGLVPEKEQPLPPGCTLRLTQNRAESKEPHAFFYSSAFPVAGMTLFGIGIPAAISLWLYNNLGLDPMFNYPSADPRFGFVIVTICLYLSSLCWCLCTLFGCAYATFPLHFTSTEYDVHLYPDKIMKDSIKGWFAALLTFNCECATMSWEDLKSISLDKFSQDKLDQTKFADLPEPLRSMMSGLHKYLELQESVAARMRRRSNYLVLEGEYTSIKICLDELTNVEKNQLFRHLKEHAPLVPLSAEVQEELVGSKVLNDPRYTEIWFDILSDGIKGSRTELENGALLKHGQYEVAERLRAGGEAVVYRAKDRDGAAVVLKRFQLVAGDSVTSLVESAASFENETALLSQLSHQGIVKMSDFFIEDSAAYIVLEHVEGKNLREYLQEHGPLSEDKSIGLALLMCEVLDYLHALSPAVVHRDFTPDNIIVLPDGSIKLIDFSVAEQKSRDSRSECAGKHAYTPPEQFRGDAGPVSDIYALAGVIYFMLTGRDPTPIAQIQASKLPEGTDDALAAILARATAIDPEKRFESVAWLASELKALKTGEKTEEKIEEQIEEIREENLTLNTKRKIKLSTAEKSKGTNL
ncbi:MAG: serine/threonine protein kinase [Cyanobacteria bacterium HKST-UBA02]|nr:serine/threonine protein kinase [Cyanobacteria bacterium HKST-UBA02]